MFGDIGKANVATAIGQAYLDGKLSIPGLMPIPAPADGLASGGISSEAILAALGDKPLSQLQIDGEGRLLIPAMEELKNNPPVELTTELLNYLDAQRAEFPRPTDPSPVPEPSPNPNPNPDSQLKPNPTLAFGGETVVLPPGTILISRADLMTLLGAATGSLLKEERQGGDELNYLLAKVSDQQEPYRFIYGEFLQTKLKAGGWRFYGS